MGWRSFDQQWTFDDPRLAKTDSPSLWQSLSQRQLFLVSPKSARISDGPAMTVSHTVPDLHFFCNRGGKDVLPLYRDAEANTPNLTHGVAELIAERYAWPTPPSVEDIAAYCFALVAHHGYSATFWEELEHSTVRVPLTADPDLFLQVTALGERLLWLQTFAERFTDTNRPMGQLPRRDDLIWTEPVTQLPDTLREVTYDPDSQHLRVGDGVVEGVRPEVWEFNVSGMRILEKWLGARTRKGIGRASGKNATPLDKIRPLEWEDDWNDELLDLLRVLTETVELGPEQHRLLETVVDGPLIASDSLPTPKVTQTKVPKTIKRSARTVGPTLSEVPQVKLPAK